MSNIYIYTYVYIYIRTYIYIYIHSKIAWCFAPHKARRREPGRSRARQLSAGLTGGAHGWTLNQRKTCVWKAEISGDFQLFALQNHL